MWAKYFGIQAKRKRLLKKAPPGPLQNYYAEPFTESDVPLRELEIISLDFETTGLNPDRDHIVSVGMVSIKHLVIDLESAWHQIVYSSRDMPEDTTVIHKITDDTVATGKHIPQIMPEVLERLRGNVLLVHHAATDAT